MHELANKGRLNADTVQLSSVEGPGVFATVSPLWFIDLLAFFLSFFFYLCIDLSVSPLLSLSLSSIDSFQGQGDSISKRSRPCWVLSVALSISVCVYWPVVYLHSFSISQFISVLGRGERHCNSLSLSFWLWLNGCYPVLFLSNNQHSALNYLLVKSSSVIY